MALDKTVKKKDLTINFGVIVINIKFDMQFTELIGRRNKWKIKVG